MKLITLIVALSLAAVPAGQAQVLKKLGNKVEKKLVDRADRKVDRSIDKVLDKADKETDKPLDDALNKPKSPKKEKEAPSPEQPTKATNNPVAGESVLLLAGGDCSDFIWFSKDAMMEFEYRDAGDKAINRTKMVVNEVNVTDDGTIALVNSSDDSGHSFDLKMVCAGGNLYMDFGTMMKQALAQSGQPGIDTSALQNAIKTTEISFDDAFLLFPKSMYAGQELPDTEVTIKNSPTPQMTMEITSTLSERKVEAKETIKTAAGAFDCVKISGRRHTNMKIMGMNKDLDGGMEYLWFAPGIGVIKQDTYDDKNNLQGSMQLSGYKR